MVVRGKSSESQTLSSVFLARAINCYYSSELVVFFLSRFVLFHQSKLDYHSRQHGHNLGRLANRLFLSQCWIYTVLKSCLHRMTFELKSKKDITCEKKSTKKLRLSTQFLIFLVKAIVTKSIEKYSLT